jgi:rhodanese-related sulfurtransferase
LNADAQSGSSAGVGTIAPEALHELLAGDGEIALVDVREEGNFSQAHIFYACCIPRSRLEIMLPSLVPRLSTPLVFCGDDIDEAERAATTAAANGYRDVAVLADGVDGWQASGFELFSGVNVPSKTFGEIVEHRERTPSIAPEELARLLAGDENVVVLDSRPMGEFNRMSIPSGICCPGGELVRHVSDLVPDDDSLVVVNCAGRTRSIIGAQSLINAGLSNQVVALRNGTMGWALAGLDLDHGKRIAPPELSASARAWGQSAATAVAERHGAETVSEEVVRRWRGDPDRSLFLLDVRSPEEYERGHWPDSVSAPGGQLVQATDRYIGTLGSRVVVIDDDGIRACMAASWLRQMGWDVYVLTLATEELSVEHGPARPAVLGAKDDIPAMTPVELSERLANGGDDNRTVVFDLSLTPQFIQGRIPGARHLPRRLLAETARSESARTIVLCCADGRQSSVCARELTSDSPDGPEVCVVEGGFRAWADAGLDVESGKHGIFPGLNDAWRPPFEGSDDLRASMQAYLTWEVNLIAQAERDATARYSLDIGEGHGAGQHGA